MATQLKTESLKFGKERIIRLSREETLKVVSSLIALLADAPGGGVADVLVHCEDKSEESYRIYLIPEIRK